MKNKFKKESTSNLLELAGNLCDDYDYIAHNLIPLIEELKNRKLKEEDHWLLSSLEDIPLK